LIVAIIEELSIIGEALPSMASLFVNGILKVIEARLRYEIASLSRGGFLIGNIKISSRISNSRAIDICIVCIGIEEHVPI
jgi:hypothetical protein